MINKENILPAIILITLVLLLLFGPKGNLYDYLKQKRLEYYYRQKFEKNKIICHQCKGSGEYPTDVNKLMMDAKMQLFVNKHLTVDKCENCIKLPDGENYRFCDIVDEKYQILLKEYELVGAKINIAMCNECMGSGEFTMWNPDGSYVTQDEYEEIIKKKTIKIN
jgi:hypothetical protein